MYDDGNANFGRVAIAKGVAAIDGGLPHSIASKRWGTVSPVAGVCQKMVFASDDIGDDENWNAFQRGIIRLVASRSLVGRISPWRPAQYFTPTLRQTVAPSASFVIEGKPVAVTQTDLEATTLRPAKIGTILITTKQVIQGVGQNLESAFTSDLVRAIAAAESEALIDPAFAGGGDIPQSLTYSAASVTASGTTAEAFRNDLDLLMNAFSGDLESAFLVMHPNMALQIMMMQNPLGSVSLTLRGGDVFGIPTVTSSAVPYDSGGSLIALIDPTRVLVAQNGVEIDVAQHATLQISENPDDPVSASTVMVNLWQRDLIAFYVKRSINWQAMPGAVAYIDAADYGASA